MKTKLLYAVSLFGALLSPLFLKVLPMGENSAGACFSQTPITITGADLPQAGDNFIVANDTSPNILLGIPGSTPQNWNFTSVANHYYKAAVYDSTSATPFAAEFPASNISTFGPAEYFGALYGGAPVGSGYDGYMFWSSDTSGLKVIGWKAIDGPYAYKPIHTNPSELLIGTPASYGTTFLDTSRWDMLMNDVPSDYDTTWISNRTKSLSCDAWGSLSTPFGNFQEVIRIHETVVEIDSAVATYFGNPVYSMEVFRDTMNNYIFMAKGVGYPLAIIHADKNNNIKDIEYLIDTTCSVYTEIFGTIMDSTGSIITDGNVYLYQFLDDLTPLTLVDSATIDSSGFYGFYYVEAGQYMVSAEANITVCPSCIPTYFGNVGYWADAGWMITLCVDSIAADIWLTQLSSMNGNGFCSGLIQLGTGKTAGDPIPGIDISLEQVPGGIKAHTTSDQTGNYSFANVEPGTYRLLVDVPGLPMDSTYQFTISGTDTSFTDLNFTVDTTQGSGGIFVGYPLSAKQQVIKNNGFRIYPNPAADKFTFESRSGVNGADVTITDLSGKEIWKMKNFSGKSATIDLVNIPAGFYFLKMTDGKNILFTEKISIIR